MAYLGKEYKFVKQENFEEFLSVVGLPANMRDAVLNEKPSTILVKNGDTYSLTTTGVRARTLTFVPGVEFDETVNPGVQAKTSFTIEGDTITQIQRFPNNDTVTLKRVFNGDQLVVTCTKSNWDGTAYRYYAA